MYSGRTVGSPDSHSPTKKKESAVNEASGTGTMHAFGAYLADLHGEIAGRHIMLDRV